jgi:hypothetical protein
MSRRILAPIVVAAAVAGGGVAGALIGVPGISSAQDAPTQTQPAPTAASQRDGAIRAAADALGLSVKDLGKELRGGTTIADLAKEKGVDVDDLIDKMVAAAVANGRDEAKARDAITKLVNNGRPDNLRHRPAVRHAVRGELGAAAGALGMEPSALAQELKDGKTIAQVAQEKGVDVDTVIDAMVAPVKERITKFVNDGRPHASPDATSGSGTTD